MSVKNKISEALSQLKFIEVNGGLSVETVDKIQIPKTWDFFPNSEDIWIKVKYPSDFDIVGCMYKAQIGSVFDGHVHYESDEVLTVVNEGGEIHVFTPKWNKKAKFNESITIPRGVPHVCVFNSFTVLNIIWHPSMGDWSADFLSKKQ